MQLPLTDPETLCEALLQDLPSETVQMARAFKACVRAKKGKTPAQLLRVVFFYCGLDQPLREEAGTLTALYESMTPHSVAERLRACGPWVKALRRRMLPLSAVETLPTGRRFPPATNGCSTRTTPAIGHATGASHHGEKSVLIGVWKRFSTRSLRCSSSSLLPRPRNARPCWLPSMMRTSALHPPR